MWHLISKFGNSDNVICLFLGMILTDEEKRRQSSNKETKAGEFLGGVASFFCAFVAFGVYGVQKLVEQGPHVTASTWRDASVDRHSSVTCQTALTINQMKKIIWNVTFSGDHLVAPIVADFRHLRQLYRLQAHDILNVSCAILQGGEELAGEHLLDVGCVAVQTVTWKQDVRRLFVGRNVLPWSTVRREMVRNKVRYFMPATRRNESICATDCEERAAAIDCWRMHGQISHVCGLLGRQLLRN